ncbi:MAG: YgaP-like transmembrane domain [Ferruginibacter sp.]
MGASKSMRVWFALVGIILWAGIYLTGFSKANWLLYVPAAGFIFSAITGLCPSLTAITKMFDRQM